MGTATTSPELRALAFHGRQYLDVYPPGSLPPGMPTPAQPSFTLGSPLGSTTSRWQSRGALPAGTAIWSVAKTPSERMIAVKRGDAVTFLTALPAPRQLETTQVVLGTVTSFGPAHWDAPEGTRPPNGPKDAAPPLKQQRFAHTATLLPDGQVLFAGGEGGYAPRGTSELYTATR